MTFRLALVAAILIAVMQPGWSQNQKPYGAADPQTYKAEYINPVPGEFPIQTWGITDLCESSPQWFEDVAACGINLGILLYYDVDKVKDALRRAEGSGMKIMTVATSPEAVRELRDFPALGGYFLADEPKAGGFEGLRKVRDRVYANDTTHLAMINLYPWTPTSVNGAPTYEDYINEAVAKVGLPVISYDNYPITLKHGKRTVATDFYKNLELIAGTSKNTGIPFWAYGRTKGGDGPFPIPTEADLTFEVFSALAYGAQGISYFTYTAFNESEGQHLVAPVDSKGRRTPIWDILRNINIQIQNLRTVFLGAEMISVRHTGTTLPEGTLRLNELPAPFASLSSGANGILFSHLRNGGKDYYVMVNHDIIRSQRVRFTTSRPIRRVMGSGSVRTFLGSGITLPPGGYAIFTD